jgi:hypothetical protein
MKNRILYLLMSAVLVIPSYPGSKKISEKKISNGGMEVTMIQYESSDPASRIIDFYINKLTAKSRWFLNHKDDKNGVIYLTGQDRSQLQINCADSFNRGINDIIIIHSTPITQEIVQALTMNTDFPGEDIASIPRYPGSVRKVYTKMDNYINVVYESNQPCFDCVLRFYQAELIAQGWQQVKEVKTNLGKALQIKDPPAELKDYLSELEKCPFIVLHGVSNNKSAQVALAQKDNTIMININYFEER